MINKLVRGKCLFMIVSCFFYIVVSVMLELWLLCRLMWHWMLCPMENVGEHGLDIVEKMHFPAHTCHHFMFYKWFHLYSLCFDFKSLASYGWHVWKLNNHNPIITRRLLSSIFYQLSNNTNDFKIYNAGLRLQKPNYSLLTKRRLDNETEKISQLCWFMKIFT